MRGMQNAILISLCTHVARKLCDKIDIFRQFTCRLSKNVIQNCIVKLTALSSILIRASNSISPTPHVFTPFDLDPSGPPSLLESTPPPPLWPCSKTFLLVGSSMMLRLSIPRGTILSWNWLKMTQAAINNDGTDFFYFQNTAPKFCEQKQTHL